MKTALPVPLALALLGLTLWSAAQAADKSPAELIPQVPWAQTKGPARQVRGLEELFALIDGGAEAYISHGFVRAAFQSYQTEKGGRYNLEIYELEQETGAAALFQDKAQGLKKLDLADEAARGDYYLLFRRGKYYVALTGPNPQPVSLKNIEKLARAVLTEMN